MLEVAITYYWRHLANDFKASIRLQLAQLELSQLHRVYTKLIHIDRIMLYRS